MMRIPGELLEYKQWVLWRGTEVNGRISKIPISPWSGKAAACDKPQTWSTYRHARYALRRHHCDGIGFVFTEADPFCGIDLDHCRSINGSICPEALELIKRFDSYAELSPSGRGAHILIRATLTGTGRRTGGIEMYDSGRYFTVTGRHLSGTPLAIHDRQGLVTDLQRELFVPLISSARPKVTNAFALSDEEVIQRAKNARNGDRFRRLWAGDASDYENDHSRADLALCRTLVFWCRGDTKRVDHLFRRSGLIRGKWDRQTGDSSYGHRTIKAAIQAV